MPYNIDKYTDLLKTNNNFEDSMGDLRTAWPVLLGSVFLSGFFGFFYLLIMRKYAGCMTWSSIVLFVLFLIIGGGILYGKANNIGPFTEEVEASKKSEMIAFAIIFWLLAVISIVYLMCNMKKIRLAIAVINCSIDFTKDVNNVLFALPFTMYFIYILFMIWWLYSALYIYSSGEVIEGDNFSPFSYVVYSKTMRVALFFYFLWFLLISEFFSAFL